MYKKNKYNLAMAIALSLTSASVLADENKFDFDVYGNIHVSLDQQDSKDNGPALNSNTSAFGVKGSQKIGDTGIKAFFKLEWQYDPSERNDVGFKDRDQYIGIKGGFGKLIIGTKTSNYKGTTAKIDPLWRTQLESRGKFMGISARKLAAGAGDQGGRLTNSVNYTTASFSGFSLQGNVNFPGSEAQSYGVGARYKTKNVFVFVDYFEAGYDDGTSEGAVKVGGHYKFNKFKISGQYESSADIDGSDYWMLGGTYAMSKANKIITTFGQATGARETTSIAVLFDHKFDKQINGYVGFGNVSADNTASEVYDDSLFTIGARYKF